MKKDDLLKSINITRIKTPLPNFLLEGELLKEISNDRNMAAAMYKSVSSLSVSNLITSKSLSMNQHAASGTRAQSQCLFYIFVPSDFKSTEI